MASNGNSKLTDEYWASSPPIHASFENWLEVHGKDAFQDFRKDHPTNKLSYEAWCQSEQVYGGYLFYAAQLVWDEDGSSEDERTKRRRIAHVSDNDDPKKTVTTNGNSAPRTAGSTTPTPVANSDEISASGKRKRKPRKKYMSQELVASDEEPEEQFEVATPSSTAATPVAPAVAANGNHKSISRKPRNKPLSDETISPGDENCDSMEVDAPVIVSPLPVRSVPRSAATASRGPELPKKATPKQSSVKKSKKSFLVRLPFHLWDAVNLDEKSEEMVLNEDTDNGNVSIAEFSQPATHLDVKPSVNATVEIKTDTNQDIVTETAATEGTPDPTTANTRRGLRNRKPAQQRPYYHDAQLFEEAETEHEERSPESSSESSRKPGAAIDILSRDMSDFPAAALWDILADEAIQLNKQQHPEDHERHLRPETYRGTDDDTPKTKHFKGKGRAWKKEGSDEDEEFTPKQKKAAKAAKAAKAKAEKAITKTEKPSEKATADDIPKQKKKIGRPRKSNLSEDIVRDDSDNDTRILEGEPTQATPTQPPKRSRGRPRKSALSSELVRDDSEDDTPAAVLTPKQASIDLTASPISKPTSRPSTASGPTQTQIQTPKKRGRPRKSDASTTPAKSSAKTSDDAETYTSQRHMSTATEPAGEPKATQARVSISSAPDYSTPNLNTGAALVAPLYSSEPTPSVPDIRAPAETSVQVSTEVRENPKTVGEVVEVPAQAVQQKEERDENREMSASMSLSSDSEL